MKKLIFTLALSFTTSAFAQNIELADFNNWKMTDIASQGHSKESLFTKMNRDLIRLGQSICSNRAMVWAYDFKRFQNVDAGKIFLFFTKKTGEMGNITWWYHVAPVVNEKGTIWAMDAGFSRSINSPLTTSDWLKKFVPSGNCKEIQSRDKDLVEKMFEGYVFPETTEHGTYDCYYKITPGGFWTPGTVAQGLLGIDEEGAPISYVRDEIDAEEVAIACEEAVTSPLGRVIGNGKKRCEKYLGL